METNFTNYCKEYITDRLNDYEGTSHYLCDFASEITEGANVDGTITYSTNAAIEFIKEHFNEAAAYYNYAKDNYGEVPCNPFDNTEAYMVCMVIDGVKSLMNQVLIDNEDWDNEVEITNELIEEIKEGLEDIEIDWL